jgi:zinc protease
MNSVVSCLVVSCLAGRLRAAAARLVVLVIVATVIGLAAPALALPEVQKVVSPGGIEAWLMELNDAPVITLRLGFKGGDMQNPEGKHGTGDMTGYLFNEGAGPFDSLQIHEKLARIAASFHASTSHEHFSISFSTPSASKEEAFDLLRLAITEPHFDAEPLERARRNFTAQIEAAQKGPGSIASMALAQRLYGNHPIALDWASRKAGFASVNPADIAAYRRRVLARDNLKVAVAGNIDAATLAPLLDRVFGSLPAKAELQPVPAPNGTGAKCQFLPLNIPQALVRFSAVTPRLTWRQLLAWTMLESILHEGVSAGRLSRELREKRGLVYGVGVSYTRYTSFGQFYGEFAAKMDDVPNALAITWRELRRMVEEGPTDAELATVKPMLIGQTLLGLDTGSALASLLLNMQLIDQPTTFLDDIAGQIESITREDVWDVAKMVLDPDRLAIVIAGQPGQTNLCDMAVAQAK